MALNQLVNIPQKDKGSGLEDFAKILGIAVQLGNIAASGANLFGGAPNTGMVPAAVGEKFSLLSDQDWMKYFGTVPSNSGVGFPGPIMGSK